MPDDSEIARLEQLSREDLEVLVGQAILASTAGSKYASRDEAALLARKWIAAHLNEFRGKICSDHRIRTTIENPSAERKHQTIAAIADLISSVVGIIPVATVATLVWHYGLDKLCVVDNKPEA